MPVIRPEITETTCLGAAYAAGLAVGFWKDEDELRKQWAEDKRWEPEMDSEQVTALMTKWDKAVKRTLDWVKDTDSDAAPEAPANA